jgi:para-aminobenzoate synthetase component 1
VVSPGALSILASLPRDADCAVVRDGANAIVATSPSDVRVARGNAAFTALRDIEASGGWWAGFVSYDLGRAVEPVTGRHPDELDLPDLVFARFDARMVLRPGRPPILDGERRARAALACALDRPAPEGFAGVDLPPWRSSLDRAAWGERVARIHEHLVAGDCYQVNLTRRLTSPVAADPRALFAAVRDANPAPHEALLDLRSAAGIGVVSASPERFLRRSVDEVETRPIKGTHRDAATLASSAKDRAENVMIVDLARNDLGRVCRYGTVTVPSLFDVEAHPGLHHLVSTVRGRLRAGIGLADLLAATFPPASVTGAPKPRVMQIIEDLEPVRRGVYCGAVGWLDADRAIADLNVAIRTFTVTPDSTHLGVGAGIVADSDADAEWQETELKSHRLLAAVGASSQPFAGSPA